MRILVESLKRLYPEKVSLSKLQNMVSNGLITQEEFKYIISEA